jgi:hypothetical protein
VRQRDKNRSQFAPGKERYLHFRCAQQLIKAEKAAIIAATVDISVVAHCRD